MAVNEAEVLRQLNLNNLGRSPEEVYTDFITETGNELIKLFKTEINKTTKGSGTLAQSLKVLPKSTGYEITADRYYDYINEGVNAAPRTKGILDYFNENSLYLFEPGDPNNLKQAILDVYSGKDTHGKILERGIAVCNEHSWKLQRKHLVELVLSITRPIS